MIELCSTPPPPMTEPPGMRTPDSLTHTHSYTPFNSFYLSRETPRTVFHYWRLVENGESVTLCRMILGTVPVMVFHLTLTLFDGLFQSMKGCDSDLRLMLTQMIQIPMSSEVQQFRRTSAQLLLIQTQRIFQRRTQQQVITAKIKQE